MTRELIPDILVMLFIVLFVYAATSKLQDVELFQVQINKSPLLTGNGNLLAWLVPIGELGIACLMVMPRTRLVGVYAFFFLMVLFTAYIIFILSFSENIPCACGGVLQKLGWTEHLVFNIVFIVLAALFIYLVRGGKAEGRAVG